MKSRCLVALVLAVLIVGSNSSAQETPRKPSLPKLPGAPGPNNAKTGEQLVKVRALADVPQVKAGETFNIAFVFDIEPGWHIYWKNSGDSGGATNVKVQAPQGFAIGRTRFPRPSAFKTEDGTSYGYENQTVIFVEVTAVEDAKPGMVRFTADENWLVCKEVCLMGRAQQTIPVEVIPTAAPSVNPGGSNRAPDSVVEEFKKRLPQDVDLVDGAEMSFDGKSLTVKVPADGQSKAQFFPDNTPGVKYGDPVFKKTGDQIVATIPVTIEPQNSLGQPLRIAGLIGVGEEPSAPCYEFEHPLPDEGVGSG